MASIFNPSTLKSVVLFCCSLTLIACGGAGTNNNDSSPTQFYTLSGTLSGLNSNTQIELSSGNDLIANITLTENGTFSFASKLAANSEYDVRVVAITNPNQDGQQSCTVNNGQGSITGNIQNITVNCALTLNSYAVHGVLTGLAANTQLVLTEANNLVADITLNADGNFSSFEQLAAGTAYHFIIASVTNPHQNIEQHCTLSNGQSTMSYAAETLHISCEAITVRYNLKGTVSGLAEGTDLVLMDSSEDSPLTALTINDNGEFEFTQTLASGQSYNLVAIAGQGNLQDQGMLMQSCFIDGDNSGEASGEHAEISIEIQCSTALYFAAKTSAYGLELWKTDGTEAGTVMVKNINETGDSSPSNMKVYKGKLYFNAMSVAYGHELWVTDGTEQGTKMVKDLTPGSSSSFVSGLTIFDDKLYFAAGYNKLWVTDGTEDGTTLIKNTYGLSYQKPEFITIFNNKMIFRGSDSTNGNELWISDGTEDGTHMLKDINTGVSNSDPQDLVILGSYLYFSAVTAGAGRELWVTDGTEDGTVMVKNINPYGSTGSDPAWLTPFNGKLYFSANGDNSAQGTELWTSNGSSTGTTLVKDIFPGGGVNTSMPNNLTVFNNKLYFSANSEYIGYNLWVSDGTSNGTQVRSSYAQPNSFKVIGDHMYFKTLISGHTNRYYLNSLNLSGSYKQIQTEGDIIGVIGNSIYILYNYMDSSSNRTVSLLRKSEVDTNTFELLKTL